MYVLKRVLFLFELIKTTFAGYSPIEVFVLERLVDPVQNTSKYYMLFFKNPNIW